jgi:hypothetical protein
MINPDKRNYLMSSMPTFVASLDVQRRSHAAVFHAKKTTTYPRRHDLEQRYDFPGVLHKKNVNTSCT